ncbi:MAG TPA: FMN-binding protein [Trebonia sp.]
MRRALLTVGGTVAGLTALLSFKTHVLAASTPAAAGTPAAPAATAPAATAPPKASAGTLGKARTVTGTVGSTQYGPMQVRLTLDGTKITKVTVLQRTDDGAESDQIDGAAIPKLTSETLAAQSAQIDAVSGATYTSSGYVKSLQSALDKAGS